MVSTLNLCAIGAVMTGAIAAAVGFGRVRAVRREMGARLRVVEVSLENAGAGTFDADIVNRKAECSNAALRLLGLDPSITQRTFDELLTAIHDDDRERVMRAAVESFNNGEPVLQDFRVRLPDGTMRWLRAHGQAEQNTHGRVDHVYGALLDISAMKEMEFEVRAREERLRDAAMAAKFYTWEFDFDRNVFTVDRPAAKKRDPQGNVIASNTTYVTTVEETLERYHPDDRHILVSMLERIRSEDVPFDIEARSMHPTDGTYHWNSSRGRIIRDSRGRKRGVRGIIQDIDNRKKAELRIQNAEARFERVTRGANDGLWEIAAGTRELWVSPRFAQMLGYEQAELLGNQELLNSITHPDDINQMSESFARHLRCGEPFDVEVRQQRKSGEWLWFRVRGVCERDAAGKPLTTSGSQQDITQQKKLEIELRQAQKLESVGRLAAGVAHEINTPVQFVSDNVQFVSTSLTDIAAVVRAYRSLQQTAQSGGDVAAAASLAAEAERDADLDYVLENAPLAIESSIDGLARIATIVRSMKEFAHPDQGKKRLVDLNQAIRSTLVIAQNEYKYVAEIDAQFCELPPVPCYLGEINQVILNLLVNAAHAIADVVKDTGAIGKITVRTRLDGDAVEISISDTGTGIPEAARDKIFDPFFTTKEVGKGTGQGLAIAHSVVANKHGGTLRFETECGKGTTFTVRLPIDVPSDTADAKQAAA